MTAACSASALSKANPQAAEAIDSVRYARSLADHIAAAASFASLYCDLLNAGGPKLSYSQIHGHSN